MTHATLATIHYTPATTSVTFGCDTETITVDLGKVGKSVSGRRIVDRALAKAGILPGPFLRYQWEAK